MLLSYVGTVFSHDKLLLRQQPPSRKGDKSAQDSTWLWLVSCLSYLHIYITHMYTNCTNSDSCWIRCTPVTILYPHAHILKNSCFRFIFFSQQHLWWKHTKVVVFLKKKNASLTWQNKTTCTHLPQMPLPWDFWSHLKFLAIARRGWSPTSVCGEATANDQHTLFS